MSILESVINGYKEAIYFTNPEETENSEGEFSATADAEIHNGCTRAVIFTSETLPGMIEVNLDNAEAFGNDLWLTRNHHGAGFWDGNWDEAFGRLMTAFCHGMGSKDVILNDDNEIEF
jgi:hypothetical protein